MQRIDGCEVHTAKIVEAACPSYFRLNLYKLFVQTYKL